MHSTFQSLRIFRCSFLFRIQFVITCWFEAQMQVTGVYYMPIVCVLVFHLCAQTKTSVVGILLFFLLYFFRLYCNYNDFMSKVNYFMALDNFYCIVAWSFCIFFHFVLLLFSIGLCGWIFPHSFYLYIHLFTIFRAVLCVLNKEKNTYRKFIGLF